MIATVFLLSKSIIVVLKIVKSSCSKQADWSMSKHFLSPLQLDSKLTFSNRDLTIISIAFVNANETSNRKKINKNGYVGLPVQNIFLQQTNPYINCQRATVQWLS